MAKSTRATEGRVYFILAPAADRIKIGFSVNFDARYGELKLSSPIDLQLLKTVQGTHQLEITLLAVFNKYRLHGEWFRTDAVLLDFISSLVENKFYSPEEILSTNKTGSA